MVVVDGFQFPDQDQGFPKGGFCEGGIVHIVLRDISALLDPSWGS